MGPIPVWCTHLLILYQVFCGNIGGTERKEFTVIGRGVNLSARLMVCESVLL